MSSSAADTRTVRAVSQFPAVNTSRAGRADSPSAAPVIVTVTAPPTGSVSRTTAYGALSRSDTVSDASDSVIAGVSSSVTEASKSPETLAYSLFVAVRARCRIATVSSKPLSSCWAVSVTVRGVLQFAAVNVRVFCTPLATPSVSSTVTDEVSALVIVTVAARVGSEVRRTV